MKRLTCKIVFMPTHVYKGTELIYDGSAPRILFFSTRLIKRVMVGRKQLLFFLSIPKFYVLPKWRSCAKCKNPHKYTI